MRHELSENMKVAIDDYVAAYKQSGQLLDVYKAAASIRGSHPMDSATLEDIVNRLVLRAGSDCSIEFRPLEPGLNGSASLSSINADGAASQP
jgi:hypothetical protein